MITIKHTIPYLTLLLVFFIICLLGYFIWDAIRGVRCEECKYPITTLENHTHKFHVCTHCGHMKEVGDSKQGDE